MLLHAIAETAQHAGHADIVRESADIVRESADIVRESADIVRESMDGSGGMG